MSEQNEAPWYAETVPAEAHEYVSNKGWKGPGDAVTAYQSLEKFLGADKAGRGVVLPKDENDADGWNALYSKLGRPEKPDGYGLTEGFGKTAAEWFHEAGLTPKQAQALATKWNGYAESAKAQQEAELAKAWEAEAATLKSEWGDKYDAQIETAKRAAARLGVDEATLDKLQSGMGQAGLMKFMAQVGALFAEDAAPQGSSVNAGRTPEAAQAQIKALMADKGFFERRRSGDAEAVKLWDDLHKQAFPGDYKAA